MPFGYCVLRGVFHARSPIAEPAFRLRVGGHEEFDAQPFDARVERRVQARDHDEQREPHVVEAIAQQHDRRGLRARIVLQQLAHFRILGRRATSASSSGRRS